MRNNSRNWDSECRLRLSACRLRLSVREPQVNAKPQAANALYSPSPSAIVKEIVTGHRSSASLAVSQKTWGGRFTSATDDRVEAFTESISFDRRLYRQDIIASKAHARMLAEVRLLTEDAARRIVAALDEIALEIEGGKFEFSIQLEDIHTHIERALIERLGDVGRMLYTGRSRNDQIVTDVKLWVRDALDALDGRLRAL